MIWSSTAQRFQQSCRRTMTISVLAATAGTLNAQTGLQQQPVPEFGVGQQVLMRRAAATSSAPRPSRPPGSLGVTTPEGRRAAIDAYWGDGPSTTEKLAIFDKFWAYADAKFAAFQGIDVEWTSLRDRYRPEVAAGVSRGRFAAIMNQLALALRDSHTVALDLPVNFFSIPGPGVPLLGVGGWEADPSGTCMTAQDDGSALVYSAVPNHPLGLEPGDLVLGYDGQP